MLFKSVKEHKVKGKFITILLINQFYSSMAYNKFYIPSNNFKCILIYINVHSFA